MTADLPDASQAAMEAFTTLLEAWTDEAMTAATEALVRAIHSCPDADALEQLLASPNIDDFFRIGDGGLPEWGPIVDAMVILADALPNATDSARVLGCARWCCSDSPIAIVRPDVNLTLLPTQRESALRAFGARLALYRQWIGDGSAERRSAGAHALAWCTGATPEDADLALSCASAESDGSALGSALLALGVLERRLGGGARTDAALALAREKLTHDSPIARAGAAAALALLGETLSAAATSALAEVVVHRVSLPAGWGWRTRTRVAYESNALGAAILNWVPTLAAEDAVRVLSLAVPERDAALEALLANTPPGLGIEVPQLFGPSEGLVAGALAHLAFAARGCSPPPYGLVLTELDETQRLAVEAMGRRAGVAGMALRRAGFYMKPHENTVPDFLGGSKAEWRPISFELDGEPRRWHFGPLWGATIFGKVSVAHAQDAIMATVTPFEAVDLVTHFATGRMIAYEQIEDPAVWERDQEFALAVIDEAVNRGFDLDDMMRSVASDKKSGLPAIAAVAYLRAHPDGVPDEWRPVIDSGLAQTKVAEPLHSLVAALQK